MHYFKKSLIFKIKFNEISTLIGIVLIGIFLRVFYIDQPMRFDESFTFFNYINKDWSHVFNYSAPNNHVLNTILIKITTTIFGGHPYVIRLPAFIFGVLTIPLAYFVCKRLGCFGYIAALIVAIHPYCILFSTNARGYSAIVFFTLLFLLLAIKITEKFNHWDIFKLALIGSLGLLSLPIMVFPLCGLILWLVLELIQSSQSLRYVFWKFLIPFVIYEVCISLLFYAPVVWFTMQPTDSLKQSLDLLFNNEFVKSSNGTYFYDAIRAHVTNAISIYRKDIPITVLILFGLFLAGGLVSDYKEGSYRITRLVAAVCISTLVLFILKHQMPYPRTWIFLIPILAILTDRGFSYIIEKLNINIFASVSIIIILSLYWSFTLLAKKSIYTYEDTGTYLDAEIMAKKIYSILNVDDEVIAPIIPSNLPIYYYLWHEQVYKKSTTKNSMNKYTYIIMPSDDIKLEMFSQPPHPIDTKLEIIREENAVKIFEFNGSAIYKLKSDLQ